MASCAKNHRLTASVVMSVFVWAAGSAAAQKVVVDADPAHVANTFSPVRAWALPLIVCGPVRPTIC